MRISAFLFFIIFFISGINFSYSQMESTSKILQLDNEWSFHESGKTEEYKAKVPGTIHSDLIKNNIIENPFKGMNELKIQWIEEKEWIYKTTFNIEPKDLQDYSDIIIRFNGIDTFADVYLNDKHILHTDNMFIPWECNVKSILRTNNNELKICFHSPLKSVMEEFEKYGINYPADNDRSEKHLSVYARKAPYHYGWDWGIRMVGCGIWRPVELVFNNNISINDIYIKANNIGHDSAQINCQITIDNTSSNTYKSNIKVNCNNNNALITSKTIQAEIIPGNNILNIPIDIKSPKLWMPNGWGEQNLYDITAEIEYDNNIITSKSTTTGLRTVSFINEPDSIGKSFYFKVNGNSLFAKGANYIPSDIILTNVTNQDYEALFKSIKESNINMIRVWGGGIYENDIFYDLADKYGILIWQDFMFGCSTYPGHDDFLKNVEKEAIYNIKRLRNHPSIVLWCGNNEIYEGIKYWGWDKRYTKEQFNKMKNDYNRLFRELLPKCVSKYDDTRSYIHTSPDSANWGRKYTQTYGDIHYWGIWYGKEMFDAMDTLKLRFVSEFGFESFPEMKTLKEFADEKDMHINSEVMKHHQKSSIGNELILAYMKNYYNMPKNFDDFVYLSSILQGHGISYGIETNRRQRPVCMGSLYWQLNDSWPVISWSAIDYYKNKKALYYLSKKAFAPTIISIYQQNDILNIYSISDCLQQYKDATLSIRTEDFYGNMISQYNINCNIKENSSNKITELKISELIKDQDINNISLLVSLKDNQGNILYEGRKYMTAPKNLNLPKPTITKQIRVNNDSIELTLKTDVLAKDVFIEIPTQGADFSDNFFDLGPHESKTIIITSDKISQNDIDNINIKTLKDTY